MSGGAANAALRLLLASHCKKDPCAAAARGLAGEACGAQWNVLARAVCTPAIRGSQAWAASCGCADAASRGPASIIRPAARATSFLFTTRPSRDRLPPIQVLLASAVARRSTRPSRGPAPLARRLEGPAARPWRVGSGCRWRMRVGLAPGGARWAWRCVRCCWRSPPSRPPLCSTAKT